MQLEFYLLTPTSEPMLTDPDEVQNAIRGLKVGKAPGPNGVSNRALRHLPMLAIHFLAKNLIQSSSPTTFLQSGSTPE